MYNTYICIFSPLSPPLLLYAQCASSCWVWYGHSRNCIGKQLYNTQQSNNQEAYINGGFATPPKLH